MFDITVMFSDEQKITGTAQSTNIIDLGTREIAFGTPIPLLVIVNEDFNNLTNLKVAIKTAETEDMADAVELASSTVALENLKEGNLVPLNFMPAGNKGYVQLEYTVTGTAPTTGKLTAGFVDALPQGHHNK